MNGTEVSNLANRYDHVLPSFDAAFYDPYIVFINKLTNSIMINDNLRCFKLQTLQQDKVAQKTQQETMSTDFTRRFPIVIIVQ